MQTPWGAAQTRKTLGDGVTQVTTAGHGGIHLIPDRNRQVHAVWRDAAGWYEEDDEWSVVAVTFPNLFTPEQVLEAHRLAKDYSPDQYENVFGVQLLPAESYQRREDLFYRQHAGRYITRAAFGAGQAHPGRIPVPAGMVGACARLGRDGPDERWFLVPAAEYEQRRVHAFVIDEQRHTEWPLAHELLLSPDDKYSHLFTPRCACGEWSPAGAVREPVAAALYARHLSSV